MIVLIEDSITVRAHVRGLLRGFELVEAACLAAAQQHLERADLVILDVLLPDGNGIEWLQAQDLRCPVIVISMDDRMPPRVSSRQRGAYFLSKPLLETMLRRVVIRALERSVAHA